MDLLFHNFHHANIAYNLQYPIYDAGRVLIFDDKRQQDNKITRVIHIQEVIQHLMIP